ncbi:hypothetical protein QQP08_000030 [Theobroma cacao]|nr:hypothetical protein QQP08_000030 [Theobroma cacao]
MDSNPQQPAAGGSPPKPWEQAGSSSGSGPFKPPSPGSTSDVVEASGTARPGEIVSTTDRTTAVNRNAVGRPLPSRPWEQQNYGSTYGGYGSGLNYNSGYGSGMYGSYGGLGSYGGGLYGNGMYRGGYGGLYGNSGMYGGGMYGGGLGGFGGPMGGYGVGMGPYGEQDPNNPYGAPSSPPGFWISFLRVVIPFSSYHSYLTCPVLRCNGCQDLSYQCGYEKQEPDDFSFLTSPRDCFFLDWTL